MKSQTSDDWDGIEITTWYFRISVSTIALTMMSVTSVVRKARSRR